LLRTIRYQGAIIQDDCVLLIRYRDPQSERTFWLVPGGGLEPPESEEECVQREMYEETKLQVRVIRLLLEEEEMGGIYQRRKTYLCHIESGAPSPGYEPEFPVPKGYGIVEIGWFHLAQPETWNDIVHEETVTHSILLRIQEALGYVSSL
jgi:8-oxo-dGTP pyrophosphatase MutT (NUDIX family)